MKPGGAGRAEKLATCSVRQPAGAATWYPLCQCAGLIFFHHFHLVLMSKFFIFVFVADGCKLSREPGFDSPQRLWVDTTGAGGGQTRGETTWKKVNFDNWWDNLISGGYSINVEETFAHLWCCKQLWTLQSVELGWVRHRRKFHFSDSVCTDWGHLRLRSPSTQASLSWAFTEASLRWAFIEAERGKERHLQLQQLNF